MIVYRVANLKHKDSTLSGIGAEKVGGRWNEIGIRAVYCSENISLALLEYYVHSENIGTLPEKIVVAKIEIPKEFIIEELAELPERWFRNIKHNSQTRSYYNKNYKKYFQIELPIERSLA